jgi:MFS family permease
VAALLVRTRRGGRSQPPAQAAGPRPFAVHRDALLRLITVVVAAIFAAVSAVNVAEVFLVRDTLHSTPTAYGLLGTAWTAAMLAGSWLVVRRPLGDGSLALAMLTSLSGACAAILGAVAVDRFAWLVPLWVLGGLCNGAANVCSGALIARRVPAAVRGRAFAAFGAAVNGANAVGYVLGGVLLGALSPRAVFALSGAAGLAVAVAFAVPLLHAAARDRPPGGGAGGDDGVGEAPHDGGGAGQLVVGEVLTGVAHEPAERDEERGRLL